MQGNAANGWAVLVLMVGTALGSIWAWKQIAISTTRNQRGKLRRLISCVLGAFMAAFGVFCLAGAFLLPDPTQNSKIVGWFGALLLLPYLLLWWRNTRIKPLAAQTSAVVREPSMPIAADSPPSAMVPSIDVEPVAKPSPPPPAEIVDLPPIPGSLFHAFSNPATSRKTASPAIAENTGAISLPCTFRFTYADSTGATEQRTVDVARISSNGSLTYLEGHCHARNAERTFRTDRIRGSLTDMDSGEVVPVKRLLAEVRGRSSMAYRPEAAAKPVSTHTKEWQTAVLFTGFTAAKRDELEELAYAAGWDVRSTVGSTLDYLVTGPRAGSSKVAQAEELGVSVIDEDLFRALV